jgi:dTDP-glucose 4,6-dehydratase
VGAERNGHRSSPWEGLSVVVMGGAGFVGSHLCQALVDRDCRVTVLDNLATGSPHNLTHLDGQVTFVYHDVTEPLPGLAVDYVFNLASPASPDDYLPRPIETLTAGAWGTRNGLELARRTGARFLMASTSEVYGDPQVTPQPETYWGHVNPIGPRSSYDEAKRYAEALVSAYRRQHGLDIRIARIFNTYGPRMQVGDGRVIPAFFEAAIRDRPLPVHGDGSQTRSLCFVGDLVEGLLALIASDHSEPVNLGRPEEVTMLELAEAVQMAVGAHPGIVLTEGRVDDPMRRKPDISRARQVLGWEPATPLVDGLAACVPWFREALVAPEARVAN